MRFVQEELAQLTAFAGRQFPSHQIYIDLQVAELRSQQQVSLNNTLAVVRCCNCCLSAPIISITFGEVNSERGCSIHHVGYAGGIEIGTHQCRALSQSYIVRLDGTRAYFTDLKTDTDLILFLGIYGMDWKVTDPKLHHKKSLADLDWNSYLWRNERSEPIAQKCWDPTTYGDNFIQLSNAMLAKGWLYKIEAQPGAATATLWRPEVPHILYTATVFATAGVGKFAFVKELRAFGRACADALLGRISF